MIGIKIPWQGWACAGVMVVLGFTHWKAYDSGKDHVQQKWDASIKRGEKIVEGLKQKQETISAVSSVRFVEKVKVIHEKGEVRIKQVPVFIDNQPDLSGGFRLFYDSAVLNTIPDPSGIPNASPVPVEDVATTTSGNFDQCHKAIANLEELRQWARDQRAAYLEQCKQQGVHCSEDS